MQRTRFTALASAAVLIAVALVGGWPPTRWQEWERSLEDQLVVLRGPRPAPGRVVQVAIDDATLQQGSWFVGQDPAQIPAWAKGIDTLPWPRAAYGRLATHLRQAGASVVAINVTFAGPSRQGPVDDAALAKTLEPLRGHVALAAEMLEPQDAAVGSGLTLVRPDLFVPAIGGEGQLGLTNTLPRQAGQPSRHPDAYGRGLLPANGVEPVPSLAGTALRLLGLHSRQNDPAMGLNFYGPEGSFERLSAWEVLDPVRWQGHPKRERLKGAVVLVGPVVSQGDDGNATPFGQISGLEMLATATANSLQGDGLSPWPVAAPARGLLAMAPLLLVTALGLWRSGLRWKLGLVITALILQLVAGFLALRQLDRWLPLLGPVSGLVLLGLLYGGDAYLQEEREKRRLRRTFERYVAPSVVAEILSDPGAAEGILRGRLLPVTVLFSDLKGFTQLTQQRSAEGRIELHVRQLNDYLGGMVEVIAAHGGTVDKFIGDAVMAVFGSPIGRGPQQEALAALRCAEAMGARLVELNAGWLAEGIEPFSSGIGLASGQVIVGQIGSPRRLDFTVIGDKVNLASRLEGLTRLLDVPIVIDDSTAELVGEEVAIRALEPQQVKGMGMISVYTLAAASPAASVA